MRTERTCGVTRVVSTRTGFVSIDTASARLRSAAAGMLTKGVRMRTTVVRRVIRTFDKPKIAEMG
jgi:hypothetical protein